MPAASPPSTRRRRSSRSRSPLLDDTDMPAAPEPESPGAPLAVDEETAAFFAECDALADDIVASGYDLDADVVASVFATDGASPPTSSPTTAAATAVKAEVVAALEDLPTFELMRQNVNTSCEDFVTTFLSHGSSISELHKHLLETDTTLLDVERTLQKYLHRIERITRDIGVLQSKAADTAQVLTNTVAVETSIAAVLDAILVPPDVVRIILTANELELGPQFVHDVGRFGAVLAARRRGNITFYVAARGPDGSQTVTSPTAAANRSMPGTAAATSDAATHTIDIDMTQLTLFKDSKAVVRRLAALACYKIRTFIVHKIESVLGKPRTNVALQQHNVMREYRPMLKFLRHAASAFDDAATNPATVFFEDVRHTYCALMSRLYHNNMRTYVSMCNSLEIDWRSASSAEGAAAAASQAAAAASASTGFGSAFSAVFGTSRHTAAVQPLIADKASTVSGADFALGTRSAILDNIRATPVIPVVARRRSKRHSYEETFRSVNVVLCDVVTSEFLFSFDFFAGDSGVYVDVFKATIQLVVDYVADVVLRDASAETRAARDDAATAGSDGSAAAAEARKQQKKAFDAMQGAASVNTDYTGLLLLIRMVHLFRFNMHSRRLFCLDGYFDSILMLIWPAFKGAFERQLLSFRNVTKPHALAFMASARTPSERLRTVHPLTDRYAHLTLALFVLSRGIEESDADVEELPASVRQLHGAASAGQDLADSRNRFAVLDSNLAYLRLEFQRVLAALTEDVTAGVESGAATRDGGVTFRHAFAVNNLYHVLSVWSNYGREGTDATGILDAASPSRRPDMSGIGTPNMSSSMHPHDASNSTSRRPTARGGDSDDESSESSLASSTTTSALISAPATNALRLAQRLVHAAEDYKALHSAFVKVRTQLTDEVVRCVFPDLCAAVNEGEKILPVLRAGSADAAAFREALEVATGSGGARGAEPAAGPVATLARVIRAGKQLHSGSRTDMARIGELVRQALVDKDNATEVTKQAFTLLLVYNSRFHAVLTAAVGTQTGLLRGIVVTNQQLLHSMKRVTGA